MTNSGHVPQMDSRWGLWGAWLLASSHQSRMEGHASPDVLLCGAHTLSMQGSCWTLSKEGESYKPLETTYGLWADSNLRPRLEDAGHSIGQCAHFNKGREGRRETDEARSGFKGRAFEPGWQVNSYLRHSFSFCTALKICFMNNSKGGRCPGHSPSEAPPPQSRAGFAEGTSQWWEFRVTTAPGAVLLTPEIQTTGRKRISREVLTPVLWHTDYTAGDITGQLWVLRGCWNTFNRG